MSIRAAISSAYRRKLAIIGVFVTAFGLWAAYDAFIKYPPQLTQYTAWQQFKQDGRLEEWPAHARQAGWPEDEPPVRNKGHFYFNYAIFAVLTPVGLIYLGNALLSGKRWIEVDDTALRTYAGKEARLEKIIELNDRRWKSKGIALVIYEDDKGQRQRIVLDDFHYEMQPTRDIHAAIEGHLAKKAKPAVPTA